MKCWFAFKLLHENKETETGDKDKLAQLPETVIKMCYYVNILNKSQNRDKNLLHTNPMDSKVCK